MYNVYSMYFLVLFINLFWPEFFFFEYLQFLIFQYNIRGSKRVSDCSKEKILEKIENIFSNNFFWGIFFSKSEQN